MNYSRKILHYPVKEKVYLEEELDLSFEEIRKRVNACDGIAVDDEDSLNIFAFDYVENRFLTFKDTDKLDVSIFNFNSLGVDLSKFLSVVDKLDKNLFMIIDEVFFIDKKEDYDVLMDRFPSQYMSLDNSIGTYMFMDNIVVINSLLIREIACDHKDFIEGIWKTLVHELRHSMTNNPIISEDELPIYEGCEEKVEEYCISIYDELISGDKNQYCFYKKEE